jgi:DNA-directed RNA polymerase specialized sigma24 family protein
MVRRGDAETESEWPRLSAVATAQRKWTLTQAAFDGLLESLAADRERAGQLYQETRANLVGFFEWRGCPFPEDHADETINRVAKRISEGEEIHNLTKYFFGVARLLFLEIQRERARELHALSDLPKPLSGSPDTGEQRLDCLRHCLKSISSEQRELIVGYYEGEKSNKIKNRKRLSDRMKIPINTLRMRALRLREQLEECVEKCLNNAA